MSSIKINIPKIQIGQFKEAETGGGILDKEWIGKKRRSGWVKEGDGGLANFRPLLVWQFREPPYSYREEREQQFLYFQIKLHTDRLKLIWKKYIQFWKNI